MSVNVKMQVMPMRYKCVKFQLAIVTNKLCMMEGRRLTYSNCIKNWDEIAI